jgi:hypothetical protein
MSTDQNIQERAEKEYPDQNIVVDYPCSINISKGKKAAYIKGATEERELMSNQWVSVEEMLPETEGMYLISCKGKVQGRWYYIGKYIGFHINWGTTVEDITHWMPFPSSPVIKKG